MLFIFDVRAFRDKWSWYYSRSCKLVDSCLFLNLTLEWCVLVILVIVLFEVFDKIVVLLKKVQLSDFLKRMLRLIIKLWWYLILRYWRMLLIMSRFLKSCWNINHVINNNMMSHGIPTWLYLGNYGVYIYAFLLCSF